jgi:hypothetical protein
MMIKLFTALKIGAAILLAVMDLGRFSSARADDPAYDNLPDDVSIDYRPGHHRGFDRA